jgi:hypothetical protein
MSAMMRVRRRASAAMFSQPSVLNPVITLAP